MAASKSVPTTYEQQTKARGANRDKRRELSKSSALLSNFPSLLLLSTLLVVFPAQTTPTTIVPHTKPAAATNQILSRVQRRGRPREVSAEFVYMSHLFDVMKYLDDEGCYSSDTTTTTTSNYLRMETAHLLYAKEGRGDSPWLTFDTSSAARAGENITLAQVAIATRRSHRPGTCLHILTSDLRQVPCTLEPLSTRNLMTFDVTAELKMRPNENEFRVFLEHLHHAHVHKAALVIFKDMDTEQLFHAQCRNNQGHDEDQTTQNGEPIEALQVEDRRDAETEPLGRFKRREAEEVTQSPFNLRDSSAVDFKVIDDDTAGIHERVGDHTYKAGPGNKIAAGPHWKRNIDDDTLEERYRRFLAVQRAWARGHGTRDKGSSLPGEDKSDDWTWVMADLYGQIHEKRERRSAETRSGYARPNHVCQVRNFTLDVIGDLGWNHVISPRYLRIDLCSGDCPNVLLVNGNYTTYYSYLRSLFLDRHPRTTRTPPVPPNQCLPRRFDAITIMSRRPQGDVILEHMYSAKVVECGCA